VRVQLKCCVLSWAFQCWKDLGKPEGIHRRATKMLKGLEIDDLMCEEILRELNMYCLLM